MSWFDFLFGKKKEHVAQELQQVGSAVVKSSGKPVSNANSTQEVLPSAVKKTTTVVPGTQVVVSVDEVKAALDNAKAAIEGGAITASTKKPTESNFETQEAYSMKTAYADVEAQKQRDIDTTKDNTEAYNLRTKPGAVVTSGTAQVPPQAQVEQTKLRTKVEDTSKPSETPKSAATASNTTSSATSLTTVKILGEGHEEHFGALLGRKAIQTLQGQNGKAELVRRAQMNKTARLEGYDVHQIRFGEEGTMARRLGVRSIAESGNFLTSYPLLEGTEEMDFSPSLSREWTRSKSIEAQIEGKILQLWDIDFYAADYFYRKQEYLTKSLLRIKLAGLAYSISNAARLPSGVPSDFLTIQPSKERQNVSCFDFRGEILDGYNFSGNQLLRGYFLKVLVKRPVQANKGVIINVFVNSENCFTDKLKVGQTIQGSVWLHGVLV